MNIDLYNDIAIENFISFCDDMMIAEEGFGDTMKKIGTNIVEFIKKIWNGFLDFFRKIKQKIKDKMRKWSGADDDIKSKDQVIAELKSEIDQNNKKINELKRNVNSYDKENQNLKRDISNANSTIKGKDEEIAELEKRNDDLFNKLISYKKILDPLYHIDGVLVNMLRGYVSTKELESGLNELETLIKELHGCRTADDYDRKISEKEYLLQSSKNFGKFHFVGENIQVEKDISYLKEELDKIKSNIRDARFGDVGRVQNSILLKHIDRCNDAVSTLNKIKDRLINMTESTKTIRNDYSRRKVNAGIEKAVSGFNVKINSLMQIISLLESCVCGAEYFTMTD